LSRLNSTLCPHLEGSRDAPTTATLFGLIIAITGSMDNIDRYKERSAAIKNCLRPVTAGEAAGHFYGFERRVSMMMKGECVCAVEDVIHVDCASHIYPDGSVGIHNMCFCVREKEIVAVCGCNGSGKSTLLEHLNGLLLPSSGSVYVKGKKIVGDLRKEIWRDVGLVFQRPDDQLFAPTVLDDVMFGLVNMGMPIEEARDKAFESLESVGVADTASKVPNYLSGGQKRLVAIAGVIAMKPSVVAMDEPTAELDAVHGGKIEEIIKEMRNHGMSVVIATHDLEMAARLADRVCILKKGSIIADGSPEEVFYDADIMKEAGLRPPEAVELYRERCGRLGLPLEERPVTMAALIKCLDKGSKCI
jgi:cobalt/nickel transport system ATP-binding protein